MRLQVLVGCLTLGMVLLSHGTGNAESALSNPCGGAVIGVDPSLGDTQFDPVLGRAANQVFFAADTLIHSITIWKPALPDTNVNPLHLFITGTDSSAADSLTGWRPDTNDILLDGPIVDDAYTDGVHPKPIVFTFEPPFALPHRGHFSFAIKEELCYGLIALLANSKGSYLEGGCWKTVPSNGCVGLGESPRPVSGDLVFEIEFCSAPAPAIRESWGSLKALYR